MEVVYIKTKNLVHDYEQYLDRDVFITEDELVNDYNLRLPNKTIKTLYIKDKKVFDLFKNHKIVTVNTQTGKTSMSEILLLDLIRNPGMFKYLLANLFNPSAVLVEIRLFNDGEIDLTNQIRLKRIDVLSFYQNYDLSKLNATEKMRVALLFSTSHLETLLKVYKDMEITREIDGVKYSYRAEDLINTIFMPADRYHEFELYGSDKEIRAFFIVEFFELNRIYEKYLLPEYVIKRLQDLKSYKTIDFESLNKCLTTNDEDDKGISIMEQFELNPRLEAYLYREIPRTFSPLEEALFIYIKLCSILTFDKEYYTNPRNAERRKMHENIAGIEEITVDNNSVINYEFILIYAKVLSKLGLKYTLSSGFGSEQGPQLKIRYNEYLISVNAIEVTINNDLANAKMNLPLTGITSINESKVSREKFTELFAVIQDIYQTMNRNKEEFDEALNEYNDLFIKADISPLDKLNFLVNLIEKQRLHGIEALEYINHVYQQVLGSEFHINFISAKGSQYYPVVILSTSGDTYYQIKLDQIPKVGTITDTELIAKFESGEYAYTNRQDKIPGLKLQGGQSYVRRS